MIVHRAQGMTSITKLGFLMHGEMRIAFIQMNKNWLRGCSYMISYTTASNSK
jgi:hypothetical protein